MASTQDQIPIADIRQDVVMLKNGNMAVVLETSAVNFGLLSEQEQLAIISSFAGLLNSLTFPIQIVIRSKKLDITSYLRLLDRAQQTQTNPLLVKMIDSYRAFIRSTIQENEVLDKRFFIVVPLAFYEVGLIKNSDENFTKALNLLLPRRDHIIRQLARAGLKATQLTTESLIKLFYDVYNPVSSQVEEITDKKQEIRNEAKRPASQPNPQTPINPQIDIPPEPLHPIPQSMPAAPQPRPSIQSAPQPPQANPVSQPAPMQSAPPPPPPQAPASSLAPSSPNPPTPAPSANRTNRLFILETLPDQYGNV